mmetsp:Transcript_894/g.1732  ORF Transcript_894/g.1732 Transcript_894/m.1732 type:complete len:391 (+) Transcript_894:846-2018(+)
MLHLCKVDLQSSDFLLFSKHGILALLQELLLDVGLLPQDAELVIPIDELCAREISRFHCLLVLAPQHDHLLLDGIDDGVQFVNLNDVLLYLLVEAYAPCSYASLLILQVVVHHLKLLCLLSSPSQLLVLEGTLHPKNLNFVVQDLQLLLHLRQVLRRLLDVSHILVALVFHNLVHGAELLLLLADLLVLFLQILLFELLHGNLVGSLSAESMRLRGVSSELLAMRGQSLEVSCPMLLLRLQVLQFFLHILHLLDGALILLLLLLLQALLLEECSDEEVDLSLDVFKEFLLPLDVLFLTLGSLLQILLRAFQGWQSVCHTLFDSLGFSEEALEPLELLLERSHLLLSLTVVHVQLIKLLVQTHAFHDQLVVSVVLSVQPLLHVLARLVCDL